MRVAACCVVALLFNCRPFEGRSKVLLAGERVVDASGGHGSGEVVAGDGGLPIVTIIPPPPLVRGGTSISVVYHVTGSAPLADVGYAVGVDASVPTDFTPVPVEANTFSLTVPAVEAPTARVYLRVTDADAATQVVASAHFHIDAQAPLTRLVTVLPQTRTALIQLSLASCDDVTDVLVNESSASPQADDTAWQPCATRPLAYTLGGEGEHTLSLWLRDAVGNVTTSATHASVLYDATPPAVILATLRGGEMYAAGTPLTISYVATDNLPLATDAVRIDVSLDGGSSWTTVPGCSGLPAMGDCLYNAPVADVPALRFRATVTDALGWTASEGSSGNNAIDASPPVLVAGQFAIDGNRASAPRNFVSIGLVGHDSVSPIGRFCLKWATPLAPAPPTPAAADPCWSSVSVANGGLPAGQQFQISPAFTYAVGPVPGTTYRVYGWLEDGVGHISALTNGGNGTSGTDRDDIFFKPATPPIVDQVVVTNMSPPSSWPVAPSGLCFKTGSCPSQVTAYISWRATDDLGLPPQPVALEYSVDGGVTFNPLPEPDSQARPNDGTDGSTACPTIPTLAPSTGCYAWSDLVPSVPFTVRVKVTDADGLTGTSSSELLNNGVLRVIAGNTDRAFGASAESVIFNPPHDPYCVLQPFAASNSGVLFVLDPDFGVVRVHPQDGLAQVLIGKGNSSLPSDFAAAALSAARLGPNAGRIALDYSGALLIYDGTRIRRISDATRADTSSLTIASFIGGGGDVADTTTAQAIMLDGNASTNAGITDLAPLPNGDLLFSSELTSNRNIGSVRLRRYHAATGQISSLRFGGTGHTGSPTQPLATCNVAGVAAFFDPASQPFQLGGFVMRVGGSYGGDTSCPIGNDYEATRFDSNGVASGPIPATTKPRPAFWQPHPALDGNIYATSKYVTEFLRFNRSSGDWTVLMGQYNVELGSCVDGSDALDPVNCHVTPAATAASPSGQVFFYESGRVRIIDAFNKVHTLAGQARSFGEGGSPLSARFDRVHWLGMWNDSGERKIITGDILSGRIRELSETTTIKLIGANDGHSQLQVDTGTPPAQTAYATASPFAVGPSGEVLMSAYTAGVGQQVIRMSGRGGSASWSSVVGGGATPYTAADGLTGSQINLNIGSYNGVLAASGRSVFAYLGKQETLFAPTGANTMMKIYDGNIAFTQSHVSGVEHETTDFCLGADTGTPVAATCELPLAYPANLLRPSADGARWLTAAAGADRRIIAFTPGGNAELVAKAKEAMKAFVYVPDFGGTWAIVYCDAYFGRLFKIDAVGEALLTQLPTGMTCDGNAMLFDSNRRSIIFAFRQNSLGGIAEYTLP